MTSGEFTAVRLDSIIIKREERHRQELKGINELAISISNRGLIHPPVITRDHVLVAGERRVEACKALGWTHIPIQWVDELPEHELKAIELEENIKRHNLEWYEHAAAVKEYHENRQEAEQNWTQEKTAKALGVTQGSIAQNAIVAKALESGKIDPKVVKTFSTALGILERESERARTSKDETIRDILSEPGAYTRIDQTILNANFLEWAPVYDGPKFNLIHCDFPYGIGADSFNQGAAPAHGGYDDTPETYRSLCNCLLDNLDRFCSNSAHLVFWFSMENYAETLELLRSKFDVSSFPLIWLKSDNSGILPDPQRGPRRIYETAFFGSRGDRKIVRAVSNAYAAPSVKDSHMSEKSEPMLRYFFGMIVDQYTSIFDPTCGSGSAIRAAESLDAKRSLGLEMNSEFVDRARLKLSQSRSLRKLAP